MKKVFIYTAIASVTLIAIILLSLLKYWDNNLHITFCDVGQGDAILITTPSEAQILIDGGPDKSALNCLARNMPFWDRSIDVIILTHPHADHLTGLADVIDRYKVRSFYTEKVSADSDIYKFLEAKLADKKVSAKDLYSEDVFREKDGVKLSILWPSVDEIKKGDLNNTNLDLNGLSVVALVSYGNFSLLLTGDAGEVVLDQIINEAGDVDVLKVPHHGSKTGMTDFFLSRVMPQVAVISVGEKNRFGHPSKISLDLLKKHNVKTFRTDRDGEVEIVTDGKTYEINSFKN